MVLIAISTMAIAQESDITVSPGAGGGLVVTDADKTVERFRVGEDGTIRIPALDELVKPGDWLCWESATGHLTRCGPPPAGAQGATGPQGGLGPPGDTGPQGATGPQGLAGPQGATGPQGESGPPGDSGPQGNAGPQGAPGPQGSPGPQGDTGPQGGSGPQGVEGPQGPAGPAGATGPQGPAGSEAGRVGFYTKKCEFDISNFPPVQSFVCECNSPFHKVISGTSFNRQFDDNTIFVTEWQDFNYRAVMDVLNQDFLTMIVTCCTGDRFCLPQSELGTIGDLVWLDTDGDGVRDNDEGGIGGVTLELVPQVDPPVVYATTTTAANGSYAFQQVPPGVYTVRVVTSTLPDGVEPTFDLNGIGTPHQTSIALGTGSTRNDVDFGYHNPP